MRDKGRNGDRERERERERGQRSALSLHSRTNFPSRSTSRASTTPMAVGDARKGDRKKERLTARVVPHKGGRGDTTITNTTAITGCVRFPRAHTCARVVLLFLSLSPTASSSCHFVSRESRNAARPRSRRSTSAAQRRELCSLPPSSGVPSRDTLTACAKYFSSPSQLSPACTSVPENRVATRPACGESRVSLPFSFVERGKSGFAPLERKVDRAMRDESRGNLTFIVAFIATTVT